MKKYDEAVKYLYGIPRFVAKTTPENTKNILKLIGNPEKGLRIFHVAGSNGKGSVCAFIDSVLREAGFHVGLFTSPHLIKPNERIKIDGMNISDEVFLSAFNKVYEAIHVHKEEKIIHPSFFEFIFLMSLLVFKESNLKYVILEVGLGGRLDTTNVIEGQLVSVITSLSLEHTEILGDTIEQIAMEKAGIIKDKVPVIYDAADKRAAAVIEEEAEKHGCSVCQITKKNIKLIKKNNYSVDFSLNCMYYDNACFTVSFPALYQTVNAALAICAIAAAGNIDKAFKSVTLENIKNGIRNTRWAGRMEHISLPFTQGDIYLDGAHNVSGIERLMETVADAGHKGDVCLLFGVVKEKAYDHMIKLLLEGAVWKHIYVAGLDTKRTADQETIAGIFKNEGASGVTVYNSAAEAFKAAIKTMKQGDCLYVAGSLYLIGEIKGYIEKLNN